MENLKRAQFVFAVLCKMWQDKGESVTQLCSTHWHCSGKSLWLVNWLHYLYSLYLILKKAY